jgi:hypothetical protein
VLRVGISLLMLMDLCVRNSTSGCRRALRFDGEAKAQAPLCC